MSVSQNNVPNGPSDEVESKNTYEPGKISTSGNEFQQPIYAPQQVDGAARPPLLRLDSRSTLLAPRPGFPNPLLRPPHPRPPPPGGTPTPFIQRPPLPQQRPPGPGQNIFPQGTQPNVPRQLFNPGVNVGARPPTPFQRPQAPGVRPQNLFQQRAPPVAGSPRPPFNSYQTPRGQTLDSEPNLPSQHADNADAVLSALNKNENERPALAAMKNRSFSVTEPKPPTTEDRRRSISSVSSVGSIEEEKQIPTTITSDLTNGKTSTETYSRPESRTDTHMRRIEEDEDNTTSNKLPSKRSSLTNNAAENVTEKVMSNLSTSPSPNLTTQQSANRSPSPASPLPQQRSPVPPLPPQKSPAHTFASTEKSPKSPTRGKNDFKEENANFEKPERKSPDLRTSGSAKLKLFKTEGDNDSGVDESTQGNDPLSNGDQISPKKPTKSSTPRSSTTPTKNRSFSRGSKSPNPKSPDTPTAGTPTTAERKKVPMNKVQVGSAPSPNLKVVKSKIGSLQNASHKPGGGHIKIENRKIDFSTASSRITAKNDAYIPGGGDKKIQQQKLAWSAKSKIGSLENATHKPKGGDKKIETIKLDFKDKAKPKIGSKDNMKHVPGGGDVKIESKKLDIKVQSKIGSLDNIKHKPGGGDKKIFDDKDYLRQSTLSNASLDGSQKKKARPQSIELNSPAVNLVSPTQQKVRILEEVQVHEIPSPSSRPSSRLSRCGSARSRRPSTPRPPWRY